MEQSSNTLQIIAIIIAVFPLVVTIVFGYVFWKLSHVFVNKEDMAELKADNIKKFDKFEEDRIRMEGSLETKLQQINKKIDMLILELLSK